MKSTTQRFGQYLRARRLAKGLSLRKFAELVEVSPTYLSHVEQGKVETPPTAERVRRMAELLDENPDELIALADRVPEELRRIFRKQPAYLGAFLREASGLTADQLVQLTEQARRLKGNSRR